jgi:hypothetical protein
LADIDQAGILHPAHGSVDDLTYGADRGSKLGLVDGMVRTLLAVVDRKDVVRDTRPYGLEGDPGDFVQDGIEVAS